VYTPMFVAVYYADPLGVNSIYSSSILMYATDAQPGIRAFATRANNMVRYRSPSDQAWYVDVGYGFGEVASPNRNNGNMLSAAFGYRQQPYMLLYSMQRVTDGSAAAPVDAPATTRHQALSAAWNVTGDVRLMGAYVLNQLRHSAAPVGDAKVWMLGTDWDITPVHRLIFTAAQRKVDGSPRRQTTWSAGYDYKLSQRTTAYARWRHLRNAGGASAAISGVPMVADSGNGARVLAVGISHSF